MINLCYNEVEIELLFSEFFPSKILQSSVTEVPLAEIIKMNPDTLTVEELLKRSSNLKGVLILGIDSDDKYFFGVAELDVEDMVYMMERCKYNIMKLGD